jgi:hydroxymethylbilane synthase
MDRELAGIILAAAGIERLQILGLNSLLLEGVIPAVNQGVLVAQYRGADLGTQEIIFALRDRATEVCFQAERECIQLLNADCHSALGVFARISGSLLTIEASVLSPEGDREVSAVLEGSVSEPAQLGTLLAKRLEQEGARELLGAAAR